MTEQYPPQLKTLCPQQYALGFIGEIRQNWIASLRSQWQWIRRCRQKGTSFLPM